MRDYYFLMPWQGWATTIAGILMFVVPSVLIVRRMGFSAWWLLLFFLVPGALVVGLWILALRRWPAVQPSNSN
jgi:hypothetical protein